jgi:hypothetical protein
MTAQAQVIPITPEVELEMKTLSLYEKATNLTVTDTQSYAAAGELGKGLKALEKEITEYFEPLRVAAKANYDAILKKKNDELAPVTEAMNIVRSTINVYIQEQERIRQETERKARVESEEAARKEREKLLAQAEKAIEKGKDERAESLLDKADNVYAEPVSVVATVEKTVRTESGNITQAKETQITVVDMKAFIAELLKRNSAMTMIEVKAGPLKAWVKANAIESFPGLTIKQTVGVRL